MPELKIMGTHFIPELDGSVTEWRICRTPGRKNKCWRLERVMTGGEVPEVIISGMTERKAEILNGALIGVIKEGS